MWPLSPRLCTLLAISACLPALTGLHAAQRTWQEQVASVAISTEGVDYIESGEASRALKTYSKALDIDPYNADARLKRGGIYLQLPKPDFAAARRDFQVYCRAHPNQARGWEALYSVALYSGDFRLAGHAARTLLDMDARSGPYRLALARSLLGRGRYEEAASLAIDTLSPRYAFDRGARAECYVLACTAQVLLGDNSEAARLAKRGLTRALPDHWAYPVLRHLQGLSEAGDFIDAAGSSARQGGYREKALYYAGIRAIQLGDYPLALEYLDQAVETGAPATFEHRFAKAVAVRLRGAIDPATAPPAHPR